MFEYIEIFHYKYRFKLFFQIYKLCVGNVAEIYKIMKIPFSSKLFPSIYQLSHFSEITIFYLQNIMTLKAILGFWCCRFYFENFSNMNENNNKSIVVVFKVWTENKLIIKENGKDNIITKNNRRVLPHKLFIFLGRMRE